MGTIDPIRFLYISLPYLGKSDPMRNVHLYGVKMSFSNYWTIRNLTASYILLIMFSNGGYIFLEIFEFSEFLNIS